MLNLYFCRWLVSQGKIKQAIKILKKFERINGKTVSPQIYQDFSVRSCFKFLNESEI